MNVELSKHRIEALTDGLFAIVMTLIVLEIKVPELHKPVTDARLLDSLRELVPRLFSFLLTFLLSGAYWLLHHLVVQHLRHMTRPLLVINLAFLFFVSLLPFSAALFGRYLPTFTALAVYYGNQFAIGSLLVFQWKYAQRRGLIAGGIAPKLYSKISLGVWLPPLGSLGALAAGAIQPIFSGYGFILVILIARLVARRSVR